MKCPISFHICIDKPKRQYSILCYSQKVAPRLVGIYFQAPLLEFLLLPSLDLVTVYSRYDQAHLLSRKERVLVTQVFSTVRLAEAGDARGIQPPRLGGAARGDAEADGRVVHRHDDHALVLRAVLGPPAHVGLDNVAAVQEGHLAVGLDVDLVAGVLGEDGDYTEKGEVAC